MVKKLRSEFEIERDLEEAVAKHHELSPFTAPADIAPLKAQIKELRAEMQAVLTKGAQACPECGSRPVGIHQPRGYELRCINPGCRRPVEEGEEAERLNMDPGTLILWRKSLGKTQEEAAYNWNGEDYVAPRPLFTVSKEA